MAVVQKYNSNENVKQGQLILKIGDLILAYATTATLTLNSSLTDTTNKFDGIWDSSIVTGLGFKVASEALLTEQEGAMSYETLMDKFISHQPVSFDFGTFKRTIDESTGDVTDVAIDPAYPSWHGKINMDSLELSSQKKELPTQTVNGTGTGALVKTDAIPAA